MMSTKEEVCISKKRDGRWYIMHEPTIVFIGQLRKSLVIW